MGNKSLRIYPLLAQYIGVLLPELGAIPEARRAQLRRLAKYVAGCRRAGQPANLTFICTHNSRRSHMGQIWAAAAAAYNGIEAVHVFSGGTEATAFNPRAVAALQRAGFRIMNPGGDNPRYQVTFAEEGPIITCWSKTYDDPVNPGSGFAAIMTCSEADANCPFIPGASLRLPLTYEDPKEADGTPAEAARYDERVRQIGRELCFAMAEACKLLDDEGRATGMEPELGHF